VRRCALSGKTIYSEFTSPANSGFRYGITGQKFLTFYLIGHIVWPAMWQAEFLTGLPAPKLANPASSLFEEVSLWSPLRRQLKQP